MSIRFSSISLGTTWPFTISAALLLLLRRYFDRINTRLHQPDASRAHRRTCMYTIVIRTAPWPRLCGAKKYNGESVAVAPCIRLSRCALNAALVPTTNNRYAEYLCISYMLPELASRRVCSTQPVRLVKALVLVSIFSVRVRPRPNEPRQQQWPGCGRQVQVRSADPRFCN